MIRLQRLPLAALVFTVFLSAGSAPCQEAAPIQQPPSPAFVPAHYTKYEFRIPMRDGKRLFTAVYVPKLGAFQDKGPYPFLMDRTHYSVAPYGEDQYPKHLGPSDEFEKGGYIFVYRDVRGRWMSEGDFIRCGRTSTTRKARRMSMMLPTPTTQSSFC